MNMRRDMQLRFDSMRLERSPAVEAEAAGRVFFPRLKLKAVEIMI